MLTFKMFILNKQVSCYLRKKTRYKMFKNQELDIQENQENKQRKKKLVLSLNVFFKYQV